MCIAILCPPNHRTPKHNLKVSFSNNPDGAGLAYTHKNKLIVQKGFFTLDSFLEAASKIPLEATAILHCRKKTNGPKNEENCHPFLIDANHALIHNGVLKQHDKTKEKSDTKHFVEVMLKPMFEKDSKLWKKAWVKELLEHYIGIGNKCVILSNTGKYLILRETYGVWHDGCWYSNDSFRYYSTGYWNNYRQSGYGSGGDWWAQINETLPAKKNYRSSDLATTQAMSPHFISLDNVDQVDRVLDEITGKPKGIKASKINAYAEKLIKKAYGNK